MPVEIALQPDDPIPREVALARANPQAAVAVVHLTKSYGSTTAVDDLSFEVPTGSIFGLIGPNGAGKSTTLAVLATLLAPTSGTALVHNHDVVAERHEVRRLLGYVPDSLGLYDVLRVHEYLEFFAEANRIHKREWDGLVSGLLELVDLSARRDDIVHTLSRGMKQRLSLARALVHDPQVLVLDEPASGLDPRGRVELRELIEELRTMGKTIIVSSHVLADLEDMCTHVGILSAGRLLAAGAPKDIVRSKEAPRRVRVTFRGGLTNDYTVADEREQESLLRKLLIADERPILEYSVIGGLEDLFMYVTDTLPDQSEAHDAEDSE